MSANTKTIHRYYYLKEIWSCLDTVRVTLNYQKIIHPNGNFVQDNKLFIYENILLNKVLIEKEFLI